jgi:hypothetical protein
MKMKNWLLAFGNRLAFAFALTALVKAMTQTIASWKKFLEEMIPAGIFLMCGRG